MKAVEHPVQVEYKPVLVELMSEMKKVIEDVEHLNYSIKNKLEYLEITPESIDKNKGVDSVPTENSLCGQIVELTNQLRQIRDVVRHNENKLTLLLGH